MTNNEFMQHINEQFIGELLDTRTMRHVEWYATQVAREHWTGVHSVSAEIDGAHSIRLNLTFNNEQDYMWWKLKYE